MSRSRKALVPAAVVAAAFAVGGVAVGASTNSCHPTNGKHGSVCQAAGRTGSASSSTKGCHATNRNTVHVCTSSARARFPRDLSRASRLAAGLQTLLPTTIPFTSAFQPDGGNVRNLMTIGPIHIDGLCRKTSSPGTGGTRRNGSGVATYPAPFLTIGGESEAKVLVWTETGSMSFKGQVGPRVNIPAGQPDYGIGDTRPGVTGDPVAGEGDHMFAAASNENSDEIRATDPATDNYANPAVRRLNRYPGFNYGSGPIATSDGHLMIANMLAGFDTLGQYDQCVFSGTVQVVS